MKLRSVSLLLVLCLSLQTGFSQAVKNERKDSGSIADFFKKGKFSVKARSFLMATVNDGALKDYLALAAGAGIGYETPSFKNIQFKFSSFFMTGVSPSDLSKPDSISKSLSRYELSLFDVSDPSKRSLARLEELYLRYKFHHSTLTIGKQQLRTPFINPQDSYMRPTMEDGAWAEIQELKNLRFQAGWFWKILPVSISSWSTIGKSIGLYSQGVDKSGHPYTYKNNANCGGIGMASLNYTKGDVNLQAWDVYAENLLNAVFFQSDIKIKISDHQKLVIGLQLIAEHGSGNGGNPVEEKRYVPKNFKAFALSSRVGYESGSFECYLNYTRITSDNEFLMPREWGREPFYTFMWREKDEGFGNLDAIVVNANYKTGNRKWEFQTAYGNYYLPDIKDYCLNKYGMPSYTQWNTFFIRHFTKKLEGLQALLLVTYKNSLASTYDNPKYIDNKVKLIHSSLILDYHF